VVKILGKKVKRDGVIKRLNAVGISTKPYLPAIHLFDFYKKKFGHRAGDYPVAESMSQRSLALPFYIGLQEKDVTYIVNKLLTVIKTYGT